MADPASVRLYGVVTPLFCESPTSWVQRVCQQYDLTYAKFMACLKRRSTNDIDLALRPDDYLALSELCGLKLDYFDLMRRRMGRCALKGIFRALLGYQEDRRPLYRFCRLCWHADRIPYLRLEWRLAHWRICSTHRIPMSEACPACSAPLQIHRTVLSGAHRVVASLAHCHRCGCDMRAGTAPVVVNCAPVFLERGISFQRGAAGFAFPGYGRIESQRLNTAFVRTPFCQPMNDSPERVLNDGGRPSGLQTPRLDPSRACTSLNTSSRREAAAEFIAVPGSGWVMLVRRSAIGSPRSKG